MKINYRLLLITFGIIVVISVTSTVIFFSLTTSILQSKLTNSFTKNSYDFVFKFNQELDNIESEFQSLLSTGLKVSNINIDTTSLDFIFPTKRNLIIDKELMKVSSKSYLNFSSFGIRNFIANNPNILLKYFENGEELVYYGKIINDDFLNRLSELTRIDIALIVNEVPNVTSNSIFVNQHLTTILEATKSISKENDFTIYTEELESIDFYATQYSGESIYLNDNTVKFLLFTTSSEVYEIRETMGMIMLILIVAGAALSMIFVMLFTTKLRKQISFLSKAAEYASKGEFNQKVTIVSTDEIGKLSNVFNQMLSELRNKEKREKEYSEFLTLLNQNPTLHEIAEESLKTITKELGLSVGAFYVVEKEDRALIETVGVSTEYKSLLKDDKLNKIIQGKIPEEITLMSDDEISRVSPETLQINYIIAIPINYQNKVIALLELAGEDYPHINAKEYFEIIHDQMAVGISNALTFAQLQKLVVELKQLNEQYQKQNLKITDKNEQLVKLHSELKEKASELEKEKSKALELTSLKSHFLASISHELRTPLNSIIGLSELVIDNSSLDKESHKRMSVVLKSGKKLLSLINNILEFLKIETGKVSVNKESFLISVFLKEIENIFEPQIKEKKLEFVVEYDERNDLLLVCDRQKLEQIVVNLVGNAIKFTKKGRVTLRVSLIAESELSIKIIDTGIGIKEDDLLIIFDEFRQGDGGTKRRYEGTGLGLAISKEYAQLLGGELYCDSEFGKGSEFTLLLKNIVIEKVESYEPERVNIKENKPQEKILEHPKKSAKTVFLLAGQKSTKELVGDYLGLNNFDVINIDGYEEIGENPAISNCLAIIIEQNLKNRNNWDALKKIRENNSFMKIPVIMLNIDNDRKIGYGLEVFDYFIQPFNSAKYISTKHFYEEYAQKKINSILLFTNDKSKKAMFPTTTESKMFISSDYENVIEVVEKHSPDMIFIEGNEQSNRILTAINKIKNSKRFKMIPVVCGIPENIHDCQEDWRNEFDHQTILNKQQPLDVLKVIRDRLSPHFDDSAFVSIEDDFIDIPDTENQNQKDGSTQILVVDDDEDTLYTMGEFLNELGYKYDTATNGVECLLHLKSKTPKIILLDIMMPQMDGFETIKRIKSDDRLKDIPVIALTAYAMLDNREVIEKHGFVDLITKPVNVNTIMKKLEQYMR